MDAEDIISLSACDSDNESGKDEGKRLSHEVGVEGRGPGGIVVGESVDETEVEEGQLISEREVGVVADSSYMSERVGTSILDHLPSRGENGCVNYDNEVEEGQLIPEMDSGIVSLSTLHEHIGVTERVTESEVKAVDVPSENGCMTEHPERDGCSLSGVKRTRATFEEQHPSVHVKYYGLSRQSKQKLEELLREWSEWNARSSSRAQDENGSSETGEEIYFPALDIGTGKTSAVTFWMENEIRKPENEEFNPVEDASVPLYDRGFALGLISADGSSNLEGGSELLDAPRCFNCGSYGHSLKECQKPRDNVAVNNSRKQLKSKRNQTAGMRNLTRYYQDSPGGKYEGLRPGVLDAETRRLLGLEETDPPPWLNRMREIGYPPGYLEPEDENLPSGITIYADEEIKEDKEDGEILEAEVAEVARKMSVKFPGMNAPIPKSADERVWAARPSNSGRHRNGDGGRPNHISEHNSRGRYREYNNRELKDEDPLGFDRASRYISRYDDNEFSSTSHNLRENAPTARSPRSLGDRGRNDPMDSEDSEAYRSYSSFSYNSSRRFLEHSNGLDFSRGDHSDYSSRSRERDDRHRRR